MRRALLTHSSSKPRTLSAGATDKLLLALVAETEPTSDEAEALVALAMRLPVALTPLGVGGAELQAAREADLAADLRAGRLVVPGEAQDLGTEVGEVVRKQVK